MRGFFVDDFAAYNGPQVSEALSRVPEHTWGYDIPSRENTCVRSASFRHDLITLLVKSSILMKPQYILNKAHLNRNTHKTRFCIDQFKNVL